MEQKVKLYWKGLLVLLSLCQILLEYNSAQLFLWPINYYCAGPKNLNSSLFRDSHQQSIDVNAIQSNLFDASPEDLLTAARALTMGIYYDDISRCFEHPLVHYNLASESNQTTINFDALETCSHGLHFENPGHNLSVIEAFQLTCGAETLEPLLVQSIAVGLMAGLLFTSRLLKTNPACLSGGVGSVTIVNLRYFIWLSLQCLAMVLLLALSLGFGEPGEVYEQFLLAILARSFINGSCIARLILGNRSMSRENLYGSTRRLDYKLFVCFAALTVILRAIYLPIAMRLFISWSQMDLWLSVTSISISMVVLAAQSAIQYSLDHYKGGQLDNRLIVDDCKRSEEIETSGAKRGCDERIFNSGVILSSKICDFCSFQKLQQRNSLAMLVTHPTNVSLVSHQPSRSQPTSNNTYDHIFSPNDDSSVIDSDAYQPTTETLALADDEIYVGSTSDDKVGLVKHNIGAFKLAVQDWCLVGQLWLLTFCVALNYFLFALKPNHQLIHSESTSSRSERKLHYHHDHLVMSHREGSADQLLDVGFDNSTWSNQTEYTLATEPEKTSPANQSAFDFRSQNYAVTAVKSMLHSSNPLEILWTTSELNGWIVELLVLLIHMSSLSHFGASYFKLKRLFSLPRFGAHVLLIEWLSAALLRSQNHLQESPLLQSATLSIARFCSALMLFTYFRVLLKLNAKLQTNFLIRFAPSMYFSLSALILASLAPTLERINLVLIPLIVLMNNSLVSLVSVNLGKRLEQNLCPMMFEQED